MPVASKGPPHYPRILLLSIFTFLWSALSADLLNDRAFRLRSSIQATTEAAPQEHGGGQDARDSRGEGVKGIIVVCGYASAARMAFRRAVVAASSTVLVALSTTTP